MKYAEIVSFETFDTLRDSLGRIVCTSGGFDPLHPGHASCLIESKGYGDTLVVVVNGDAFLKGQKGPTVYGFGHACGGRVVHPRG